MKNCRQCGGPVYDKNSQFCCETCREIYDEKHPGWRKKEFKTQLTGLIIVIIILAALAKFPGCLVK